VVETGLSGEMRVHEPTILHEVSPAPVGTSTPADVNIPNRTVVEQFLYQHALEPWIAVASQDRMAEVTRVARHVEIRFIEVKDNWVAMDLVLRPSAARK